MVVFSQLCGNLVAILIMSDTFVFLVIGANKMPADDTNEDLTNERSKSMHPLASELVNHGSDASVINRETKVYLSSSSNPASDSFQKRSLPCVQIESENVKAHTKHNFSKLGGLSKEYAIVKDIIVSSSVKDSLSRECFFMVHLAWERLLWLNYVPMILVFIDELDAIAPARKDRGEELSQRMVAISLNLMDGISRVDGLLVIAATNRPDSIEAALRRRLDQEIEIGVPSPVQRLDILHTLLIDSKHSLSDRQIQYLALATHVEESGCSRNSGDNSRNCSDFESSCTSIVPISSEILPSCHASGTVSKTANNFSNGVNSSSEGMFMLEEECTLKVTFEDFEKARMKVRPSAMREVILEVPKVNWEDIGGQREVKTQLMEAVEWPQKHQEAFKRIGTHPPTGILLFGPPGCSKTLMARAVTSEAGLNFLAVKGPELFSKWVGESEKAVRTLFAKARANAPSIIFFDEIDGLAVIRGKESDGVSVSDRVMSQLLVEFDGLHQRVDITVIAATNRPDKIDPALLRSGCFDRLLYLGPPNETDREEILHIHLRKIPCSSDVSIRDLACLTEGCTGADISLICREAAISALEENLDSSEITMKHLKTAIRQINLDLDSDKICLTVPTLLTNRPESIDCSFKILAAARKDSIPSSRTQVKHDLLTFGFPRKCRTESSQPSHSQSLVLSLQLLMANHCRYPEEQLLAVSKPPVVASCATKANLQFICYAGTKTTVLAISIASSFALIPELTKYTTCISSPMNVYGRDLPLSQLETEGEIHHAPITSCMMQVTVVACWSSFLCSIMASKISG
ncbi:hypothetical protein QYF36_024208 [Acer negundo]|nr:hypothetical protein QYF36_024208 [Acer negundo]